MPEVLFSDNVSMLLNELESSHDILDGPEHKSLAEYQLLYAILVRAFLDLQEHPSNIVLMHHKREAKRWVKSNSMHPWGFRWICDLLEIDYKHIRSMILRTGLH